jgi:hypothetical protein
MYSELDYIDASYLEEQYTRPQICLQSILNMIDITTILEIWLIVSAMGSLKHHIILMNDGSFMCTCLMIINFGIPCRHFFSLMRINPLVRFSMKMINKRWYNDNKAKLSDLIHKPISLCTENQEQIQTNLPSTFDFHLLDELRGMESFVEPVKKLSTQKSQYNKGFGLIKKTLEAAIQTNSFDEFTGMCQNFIHNHSVNNEVQQQAGIITYIPNPIVLKKRGRPPNRLKNSLEENQNKRRVMGDATNIRVEDESNYTETSLDGANNSKSRMRRCTKCKQFGHFAKTCKN